MGTIVIRERETRADGVFAARLVFDDDATYDLEIHDPADGPAEALFSWYFEDHLRYPFLDKDREREAQARIADYGRSLFAQVFGGPGAYEYRRMRERGFDGCRVEISGSAVFQRLHWETLRDPDLPEPLAVRLPVTRRVEPLASRFEAAADRPTLNILVVTARPDGPADVGFRTLSRPLLEALFRDGRVPVTVDLVRPGTWDALSARLDDARSEHGSGWYHVVHFDLHGQFATHDDLAAGLETGRYLLRRRQQAFDGEQGFLFFETAQDGQADPVPAAEVAQLLAEHRVPVAVLSACQSAMQRGDEASLALRLVQAGVPLTVGMAYSVTVSAAAQAIPVLYNWLSQQVDPVAALHAARRRLYWEPAREAYFNQELELDDWLLPVVYRQRPVDLRLREMTAAEAEQFYARQAVVAHEPVPEYGFVGRDLDVQTIERRLLLDPGRTIVLVRGMAGVGKSALLTHLAWWWQRTGLVGEVFRFGYEGQAWTAAQIVREIGGRLLDSGPQAGLAMLSEDAQAERIIALLRSERHLLILDNAESITADPASVPYVLPEDQRHRLRALLGRLRGGRSLVLIGSRVAEGWLAPGTFSDNVYNLSGLDPEAARRLAEQILSRHGGDDHWTDRDQREALEGLIDLLRGYPLPLVAVLPVLTTTTPARVLADLDGGDHGGDLAGLVQAAIEYRHDRLDPVLGRSLLLLAPFTATTFSGPPLDRYREILAGYPAVAALGPIDLPAAVNHVLGAGLATAHSHLDNVVELHPLLPTFLRDRLHGYPELSAAVADAHYRLYCEAGSEARELLVSHTVDERFVGQAFTAACYANLHRALRRALETAQPVAPVLVALDRYLDQAEQHAARQRLFAGTLDAYPDPAPPGLRAELGRLHYLAGRVAEDQRSFDAAGDAYRRALDIASQAGDEALVADVHHALGVIAQEQGDADEAERQHHQALELRQGLGDDVHSAAFHHELGNIAVNRRRLGSARSHYQYCLDICLRRGDMLGAAMAHRGLGNVARQQDRYAEATARYHEALDLFTRFNARLEIATICFHLGQIAHEHGRLDEAENYGRRALDICLEIDERKLLVEVYLLLGDIAEGQQRPEEAEAYGQRALDADPELNERYLRHTAAKNHYNRGVAVLEERQPGDAERSLRQALDLYRTTDDQHGVAHTYAVLGRVAQRDGRYDEADGHYQRALGLFQEAGDDQGAAIICHQLGLAAHEQQQFDEATAHYFRALDLFRASGNQDYLPRTLGLLGRLAQQRGQLDEADARFREALGLFRALGDRHEAGTTCLHLGEVAQRQGRLEDAAGHYRQGLDLLADAEDGNHRATTHLNLGLIAQELQRPDEAESHYRTALDLFQKPGEGGGGDGPATAWRRLGNVARERGHLDAAAENYLRSLGLALSTSDQEAVRTSADRLLTLIQDNLVRDQQRFDEAETRYRQALDLFTKAGDRHGIAVIQHCLGGLALDQDRLEQAEEHYRQALEHRDGDGPDGGGNDGELRAAHTYHQLGKVTRQLERFDEADAFFTAALERYLRAGDDHNAAVTYDALGDIADEQGRPMEAEEHYRQALELYRSTGDDLGALGVHQGLGGLAEEHEEFSTAEEHYRQALDLAQKNGWTQLMLLCAVGLVVVLATTERYAEALGIAIRAAAGWYEDTGRITGAWSEASDVLALVRDLRQQLPAERYDVMLHALASPEFAAALDTAVDRPEGP